MPKYAIKVSAKASEDIEVNADNFDVKEGFVVFYRIDAGKEHNVAAFPVERIRSVSEANSKK